MVSTISERERESRPSSELAMMGKIGNREAASTGCCQHVPRELVPVDLTDQMDRHYLLLRLLE